MPIAGCGRPLPPAFDFEWMNKALFYSAYQRANSYFQNTEYAARSLPDAAELALLTPMKNELPRALQRVYQPPVSAAMASTAQTYSKPTPCSMRRAGR